MKRVWITRTEPGASSLGAFLKLKGIIPIVAPVLQIRATEEPCPSKSMDIWVFVSTHAVDQAVSAGWVASGRCVAVGPATARSLLAHTAEVLVPSNHSTEGMLALIRNRIALENSVCIVAGKGGREVLETGLRSDGYDVKKWLVYEQHPAPFNVDPSRIDSILISSSAALPAVFESLQGTDVPIGEWPIIVVPSERIAHDAMQLGFGRVAVSQGASKEEVFETLSAMNS